MTLVHSGQGPHTQPGSEQAVLTLLEPTEDALDRIANAQWALGSNGGLHDGVRLLDVQTHNACNHTLSGTIEVAGQVYGFIIDSGDWAGTVVRAWGDPEDVGVAEEPEQPEPRTFLPRNPDLMTESPAMWSVYLAWRKEPWFRDMERAYNYDRYFQPGGKIEGYYREKAAKRGLVVGYLSDLSEAARASIAGKPTTASSVGTQAEGRSEPKSPTQSEEAGHG